MLVIGGSKIDEKKRVYESLQKIFGIGLNKAQQILGVLGLTQNICFKDISFSHKVRLEKIIVHYIHGFRAKRNQKTKITFLQENKSYRGVRHVYFLSVRGQKTRTNAKTQRNKKNKTNKNIKEKKINKNAK